MFVSIINQNHYTMSIFSQNPSFEKKPAPVKTVIKVCECIIFAALIPAIYLFGQLVIAA